MRQEDMLKEEVKFWLSFISDWKANFDEPIPERAQILLDNALLKLKRFNAERDQVESLQSINQSIH